HYQPKVTLWGDGTWRLNSAEALVRWQHPRLGFISPDSFIPLAEKTGLVHQLTRYVLDDALKQVAEWQRMGMDSSVAVNLSPLLLGRPNLPDEFAELAQAHGVEARRLIIELTESAAMQDAARSTEVLTRFRVKGFGLSLDDFGTGYSSLVHLHRLPFNELKIDKSFVLEIGENPESEAIVKSIIGLGHSLGLKVCAEGVESEAAMRQLDALGCDYFQGYHISKPVPSTDLIDMFANG
ncbi:MAG TPA: EAL domain-containing protein, partial [Planctomycetaceae bacterium]|nr:EAL domain-containing protein [Planctomycetaceae bacterium]